MGAENAVDKDEEAATGCVSDNDEDCLDIPLVGEAITMDENKLPVRFRAAAANAANPPALPVVGLVTMEDEMVVPVFKREGDTPFLGLFPLTVVWDLDGENKFRFTGDEGIICCNSCCTCFAGDEEIFNGLEGDDDTGLCCIFARRDGEENCGLLFFIVVLVWWFDVSITGVVERFVSWVGGNIVSLLSLGRMDDVSVG